MSNSINTRPIYERIAAAVNSLSGHEAKVATNQYGGYYLEVDGEACYGLDVVQEYSGRGWRCTPNGKLRVIVGGYGDKRQFPQRKDGSHDYTAIADLIHSHALRAKHIKAMAERREGNKEAVEAICEELGLSKYSPVLEVRPSAEPSRPFAIKVEFSATVDANKLREVHAALKALGVDL